MSGEGKSRTTLDLPGVQEELARRVHATGKPVVAVLMNGRPLSVNWLAEQVPAIVEAWFLGVQTGPALADVLFGDYNPGGKLPITFPRNVGQIPIYYNHKNTGRPPNPNTPYTVKDAYTSKYFDVPWTPLFPFGHGLSYTTFSYSPVRLDKSSIRSSDSITVTVDVTNGGKRAGDEVVQLYVRDEAASVTRPVRELRGFRRISLGPGETGQVTFTLRPHDLAVLDARMLPVVEPGFFSVFVGGSSLADRSARFEVTP
jgi:beta-glucosidase